jgi:hypothetical protein
MVYVKCAFSFTSPESRLTVAAVRLADLLAQTFPGFSKSEIWKISYFHLKDFSSTLVLPNLVNVGSHSNAYSGTGTILYRSSQILKQVKKKHLWLLPLFIDFYFIYSTGTYHLLMVI